MYFCKLENSSAETHAEREFNALNQHKTERRCNSDVNIYFNQLQHPLQQLANM